jgi:hypothetical protein
MKIAPKWTVIKSRDDMTAWANQIKTQSKDLATPKDYIGAVFNPEDLVGKIFLMDKDKDGHQVRAKIVRLLQDHEGKNQHNPNRLKFLVSLNEDKAAEIITYNTLLKYLANNKESALVWKFKRIVSHVGLLQPGNVDYIGSPYNLVIEW